MRRTVLALIALIYVQFLSGAIRPVGKRALLHVDTLTFLAFRLLFTSVVLFAFVFWKNPSTSLRLSTPTWTIVGILAVLEIVLGKYFFFLGLERASISTTSILVATFPAVITHVARVVGGEDRRERRLQSTVGVLLCCLGCALVIATPQRAQTPSSLAGILFSLLSVICSTTALFAQRRMSLDVDMSLVSAFTSLIAGLIVLGASLSLAPSPAIFHQRTLHIFTNSQSLVALLFYIFFTATTMPLKAWSVTLLGPSTFGATKTTQPLFAALCAYFLLHESLSELQALGMCVSVVGLALYSRAQSS